MALHPESLPCFSLLQEERYVSDSFMYCILGLDCQRNHMFRTCSQVQVSFVFHLHVLLSQESPTKEQPVADATEDPAKCLHGHEFSDEGARVGGRRYVWFKFGSLVISCPSLANLVQINSWTYKLFGFHLIHFYYIGLRMNQSSPFRMVISNIWCLNMYQLMMSTLHQWFIPIARRSTRFQPCCHYNSLCI